MLCIDARPPISARLWLRLYAKGQEKILEHIFLAHPDFKNDLLCKNVHLYGIICTWAHVGVGWIGVVGSESTLVGSRRFGSRRYTRANPTVPTIPTIRQSLKKPQKNPKRNLTETTIPTIPTIYIIYTRCWSRIVFWFCDADPNVWMLLPVTLIRLDSFWSGNYSGACQYSTHASSFKGILSNP